MTDVRAGQLIAASLHEAIREELPQRLDFYETWLGPGALPDRRGNLAPMTAVLGFLRTEGVDYDRVMTRAGRAAAAWTVEGLTPFRRRFITRLPHALRVRAALRVASQLVRAVHGVSRLQRRVRGRRAELGVTRSYFCTVRETPPAPLCGFYLAAAIEVLDRFDIHAVGRVARCQAIDGQRCVIDLDWSREREFARPAVAA